MKRIIRIGKGVKVRWAKAKEISDLPLDVIDVDIKVELIRALIPNLDELLWLFVR